MITTAIKDYLEAEGLATYETDLFVSFAPDEPDDIIALYDEAAPVPPEEHEYDANFFGVQLYCRGDYSWIKSKLLAIHPKMKELSGTYDGLFILDTHVVSNPQFVELDKKGRVVITAHYMCYTKQNVTITIN